jgi:hypothetical protein
VVKIYGHRVLQIAANQAIKVTANRVVENIGQSCGQDYRLAGCLTTAKSRPQFAHRPDHSPKVGLKCEEQQTTTTTTTIALA